MMSQMYHFFAYGFNTEEAKSILKIAQQKFFNYKHFKMYSGCETFSAECIDIDTTIDLLNEVQKHVLVHVRKGSGSIDRYVGEIIPGKTRSELIHSLSSEKDLFNIRSFTIKQIKPKMTRLNKI